MEFTKIRADVTTYYVYFISLGIATVISIWQISRHFRSLTLPPIQGRIIALLCSPVVFQLLTNIRIWTQDEYLGTILGCDMIQFIAMSIFLELITLYVSLDEEKNLGEFKFIISLVESKKCVAYPRFGLTRQFYTFLSGSGQEQVNITSYQRAQSWYKKCRLWVIQSLLLKPAATLLIYILWEKDVNYVRSITLAIRLLEIVSTIVSALSLFYLRKVFTRELAIFAPKLKIFAIMWFIYVINLERHAVAIVGLYSPTPGETVNTIDSYVIAVEMVLITATLAVAFSRTSFEDAMRKLSEVTRNSLMSGVSM